jgi:hypothetical protein
MATVATLPKRRRWQISLRLLVIITTLACAYFGCWRPTTINGVDDVSQWLTAENNGVPIRAGAKAPLILVCDVHNIRTDGSGRQIVRKRRYFFWYFGWVAELPLTSESVRDLK